MMISWLLGKQYVPLEGVQITCIIFEIVDLKYIDSGFSNYNL